MPRPARPSITMALARFTPSGQRIGGTCRAGHRHGAWTGRKARPGAGTQIEPGNLPYTAPTYWGGGGPGWSGFCITLPWEVYLHYGDIRILEENFPMMQQWLDFLETKAKDDLLVRWGGEWDFLATALARGQGRVNGDTVETLFFNNG